MTGMKIGDRSTFHESSGMANFEEKVESISDVEAIGTDYNFKRKIVWFNTIGFLFLHLAYLYGVYLCFYAHSYTIIWCVLLMLISGEGVTIGAHRMYAHKAFKGTLLLRIALVILHTVAGQNCMYIWVRDHRQHHKYSDTDADPHNANRGFFFSHIGWLMSRKHPEVIKKGKNIDLSDLEADKVVMFQKLFYKPLYVVFAIAIPVAIPVYFWDETYINSFFISYMVRYIIMLHVTWLVNSAAHLYGTKPYDKTMKPVESKLVSFFSIGEGWHNYHHSFPWDYRAAELGVRYSITTLVIDILAAVGLAYDLRVAPYTMVELRALRKGDGSHEVYGKQQEKKQKEDVTNENSSKSTTKDVRSELDLRPKIKG